MRKRHLFVALSVIIILVLLITASIGCVPKRNTTSPTEPANSGSTSTNSDIDELQDDIKELRSRIASQPDYSSEIARLQQDIESLQDELDNSRNDIDDALQSALNTIDTKIAEWEEKQASSGTAGSSASFDESDIQISITQPYAFSSIPALDYESNPTPVEPLTHTVSFPLSMTLENTTTADADNILLTLSLYLAISPSYTRTTTIMGGIMFNPSYILDSFQSWGPISLKAGQKKTYQLQVNILLENKTEAIIKESNLQGVNVQVYCTGASFK